MLDYPGLSQKVLSRPIFDHFPVCLDLGGIKWGSSSFRIDNKWLKLDSFKTLVESVSKNSVCRGSLSYRIAMKLKNLKEQIKSWAKTAVREEEIYTNGLSTELDHLDEIEGDFGLSIEDRDRKNSLKLNLEAISWKQKVREKWG